jgi:hypothetical protein
MSELIRNLEDALNEVASFGSDRAVTIIENALKQANKIRKSQAKASS